MSALDTGERRIIDTALIAQEQAVESAKDEFTDKGRAFVQSHPFLSVGLGVAAVGISLAARRAPKIRRLAKVPARVVTSSILGAIMSSSEHG